MKTKKTLRRLSLSELRNMTSNNKEVVEVEEEVNEISLVDTQNFFEEQRRKQMNLLY